MANSSVDRITLPTSGFLDDRLRIHPNTPRPPLIRPAISSDATMVKAVTKPG